MIAASQAIEEGKRVAAHWLERLDPGTSMGGARPKATIEDDHCLWLGKFPAKEDRFRDRWSYPLLAENLRRWSDKPEADCAELFRRMVFNAAVTNNDDHPRNHALLRRLKGWRLSPAYDLVPAPVVSLERRDLALTVGSYGPAVERLCAPGSEGVRVAGGARFAGGVGQDSP